MSRIETHNQQQTEKQIKTNRMEKQIVNSFAILLTKQALVDFLHMHVQSLVCTIVSPILIDGKRKAVLRICENLLEFFSGFTSVFSLVVLQTKIWNVW